MNKAPNTSKQYLLACQTVFRRHCKQTYSCQIGRRQTAYIEYILKSVILHKLFSYLHYGFGGIRHLTLSRQVSFSMFSLNSNNLYVQKFDRMRLID
jgi:hypothetical protein